MQLAIDCHAPRTTLPLHARPVSYLSLVVSGWYVERVGCTGMHCRALSLRYHPAWEEHTHVFGPLPVACMRLDLDQSWAESLRILAALPGGMHVASTGAVGLRLIEQFRRADYPPPEFADSFAGELLGLCERQLGIERAALNRTSVRRVIEMIEEHFAQPLPLAAIARDVGLHPTHLARSFRVATGFTIGAYIRRRRREHAEALLVECPALAISRIAAAAGFADHAHMTRTFKADLGVTPRALRATLLRPPLDAASGAFHHRSKVAVMTPEVAASVSPAPAAIVGASPSPS